MDIKDLKLGEQIVIGGVSFTVAKTAEETTRDYLALDRDELAKAVDDHIKFCKSLFGGNYQGSDCVEYMDKIIKADIDNVCANIKGDDNAS